MNAREQQIISLIHREVKPALGCTEPIAVALAVAKSAEILYADSGFDRMEADFRIKVAVSGNILKNGMGVGIPGTGMTGLHIAAALGAVCGVSAYGLEVLGDLDEKAVERARRLVECKATEIVIADTPHKPRLRQRGGRRRRPLRLRRHRRQPRQDSQDHAVRQGAERGGVDR